MYAGRFDCFRLRHRALCERESEGGQTPFDASARERPHPGPPPEGEGGVPALAGGFDQLLHQRVVDAALGRDQVGMFHHPRDEEP
jgi:hypothetical protein